MTTPETLDDLLAIYMGNPAQWRPNLYCFFAKGDDGKTTNGTLGPFPLPNGPLDEFAVWQGLCLRAGAPARLVVRLSGVDGVAQESIAVSISEPMFRTYGPAARPAYQAQQAPPPLAPAPATMAPTSENFMAIMLKSMMDTNNTLMSIAMKPRDDPSVAILQRQLESVTAELKQERERQERRSKEEKDDLMETGKKLAEKTGIGEGVVELFGPAILQIGEGFKAATSSRADIEKMKAQTALLEAKLKLRDADARLLTAAADLDDDEVDGDTPNADETATKADETEQQPH